MNVIALLREVESWRAVADMPVRAVGDESTLVENEHESRDSFCAFGDASKSRDLVVTARIRFAHDGRSARRRARTVDKAPVRVDEHARDGLITLSFRDLT